MTEDQLNQLSLVVRDLDAMIPQAEAAVLINAEEHTYTFTATKTGYLRLGVEMLKAATVASYETLEGGDLRVDVDLSHLMSGRTQIKLEIFLMVGALPPAFEPVKLPSVRPWYLPLYSYVMVGFSCFLIFALFIGIGTIVSFLLEVLH